LFNVPREYGLGNLRTPTDGLSMGVFRAAKGGWAAELIGKEVATEGIVSEEIARLQGWAKDNLVFAKGHPISLLEK
jgi:hypothetical protein